MTDSEIIKALEKCTGMHTSTTCFNCPYKATATVSYGDLYCKDSLLKDVLDLIHRQRAEIEKWQAEYKRACAERDAHICTTKFAKDEAITEFMERLKRRYRDFCVDQGDMAFVVDSIAKEMGIDGNESTR